MATALDQPTGGTARRSAGISAVLDVLDALDRHGPVTLAQLSRETGVAKSTLHRVCSTMGERGWIARDSNSGNIELGPRVAWLARANPASALTAGFYEVARGIVERHNETTCLTVLDGCESVFVAKQETTHPVRLVTAVGSRLPAFASASGRAMLADLPEHEVTAMFKGSELVTPTGRRLQGLEELLFDPARHTRPGLRGERRRDRAWTALPRRPGRAARTRRGRDHAVCPERADGRRAQAQDASGPDGGGADPRGTVGFAHRKRRNPSFSIE